MQANITVHSATLHLPKLCIGNPLKRWVTGLNVQGYELGGTAVEALIFSYPHAENNSVMAIVGLYERFIHHNILSSRNKFQGRERMLVTKWSLLVHVFCHISGQIQHPGGLRGVKGPVKGSSAWCQPQTPCFLLGPYSFFICENCSTFGWRRKNTVAVTGKKVGWSAAAQWVGFLTKTNEGPSGFLPPCSTLPSPQMKNQKMLAESRCLRKNQITRKAFSDTTSLE